MLTYQTVFTPVFIIISLSIMIGGLVGIQFLDKLFHGYQNLNAIRMFGFTIIINLIILVFLIMSFSKINFAKGSDGPMGNRGNRGYIGKPGGMAICNKRYQTVEEKKNILKSESYLDLKPPKLMLDD